MPFSRGLVVYYQRLNNGLFLIIDSYYNIIRMRELTQRRVSKISVLGLMIIILCSLEAFQLIAQPNSPVMEGKQLEESMKDNPLDTTLELADSPVFGPLLQDNFSRTKFPDGILSWSELLGKSDPQGGHESKRGLIEINNNQVEIIVGLRTDLAFATKEDRHFSSLLDDFSVERSIPKLQSLVLNVPIDDLKAFLKRVQEIPTIRFLEPNYLLSVAGTPTDPDFPSQWGLTRIHAPEAWNIESGNFSEVLVAIIDTGIDYNHPDLSSQYVPLGYDWVNDDSNPMDDHNHGTHCAGVIAATINNSIGIAGIANVKIMAEKFLSSSGFGTSDGAASAIVHAVDAGADILSNSWTGYEPSTIIHDAFIYAAEHNVVSIAAAGNDNSNKFYFPAAYPEVISVSATDNADILADFSNYGSTIEMSAPGVNIYSTFRVAAGSYGTMSGTSMACPHVAGVAALIKSKFPTWSAECIRERLRNSAEDLGAQGWDEYYGYGLVNAYQAVLDPEPVDIKVDFTPHSILGVNRTVQLTATVKNIGQTNITNAVLQIWANSSLIAQKTFANVPVNGEQVFSFSFTPENLGAFNLTAYLLPVVSEVAIANNNETKWVKVVAPEKSIGAIYSHNEYYFSALKDFYENLSYNFYEIFEPLDELPLSAFGYLLVNSGGWDWSTSDKNLIETFVAAGGKVLAIGGKLNRYGVLKLGTDYGISLTLNPREKFDTTIFDPYHPLVQGISELPLPDHDFILTVSGDAKAFLFDPLDLSPVGASVAIGAGHFAVISSAIYIELHKAEGNVEQLFKNFLNWSLPEHNLRISVTAPEILPKDSSVSLNISIINTGISNETSVFYELYINETLVLAKTLPSLLSGTEAQDSYLWTPHAYYKYSIRVAVSPVAGETLLIDNNYTTICSVPDPSNSIAFIYSHGETEFSLESFYQNNGNETYDLYSRITVDLLSCFSVVFVSFGGDPWLSSEIDAVENFIIAGGTFVSLNGPASFPNVVENLGLKFGISSNSIPSLSGETIQFDPHHPLLQGVSSLYFPSFTNKELVVSKMATPFLWDNSSEHIIGASAEVGGGHFCVIASNINLMPYTRDNDILLKNLLSWDRPTHDIILHVKEIYATINEDTEVNITLYNGGAAIETNVQVELFIEGELATNFSISTIAPQELLTLSYTWRPVSHGFYNFTAKAAAVPGEQILVNNIETKYGSVVSNYHMITEYTFDWVDPTIGTLLPLTYNSAIKVTLPFQFQFYDRKFDAVYVGSNGLLSFSYSYPWWGSNVPFPSDDSRFYYLIAPFWDQMVATGDFYVLSLTNPNRLVIGYVNMEYSTGVLAGTFEVILYESGEILFQYDQIMEVRSPTVGLNYGLMSTFYNSYTFPLKTAKDFALLFNMENKQHDLSVTLEISDRYVEINKAQTIAYSVENIGLNEETNVELSLLINDLKVKTETATILAPSSQRTFNYQWLPSTIGTYNITVFVQASGEEIAIMNNRIITLVKACNVATGIVAILNTDGADQPAYFNPLSSWKNDYQTIQTGLENEGFTTRIVTNADLSGTALLDISVLILINNFPNNDASLEVKAWARAFGNVITFGQSATFLNWAGIFVPEAEGTSGFFDYLIAESSSITAMILNTQHYLKRGYMRLSFTVNDFCAYRSTVSSSSAWSNYVPIVKATYLSQTIYLVGAYSTTNAGRAVHFYDGEHWNNEFLHRMIINAVEWVQYRNDPPEVTLLEPNNGGELYGMVDIRWSAFDWEDDPLDFTIELWDGENWLTIAFNVQGNEYYWDTTEVPDGDDYLLRIIVSDGTTNSSDVCDQPFSIRNTVTENNTLILPLFILLPIVFLLSKKKKEH